MNVSVRADRVHSKSLAFDSAQLSISKSGAPTGRAAETDRSSLLTMVALGFGGVLTLVWAGVLLWMAGYLIGFW